MTAHSATGGVASSSVGGGPLSVPDIVVAETQEQLTPSWLTAALRAGGAIAAGATVATARPHALGTGQLGTVTRVTVTYAAGDGPPAVIVKQPSRDVGSRALGVSSGIYRAETAFYRHLARLVQLRTPELYWAGDDPRSGGFTLVLEDCSGRTRPGDVLNGAGAEDVTRAVEGLAGLQAPLWSDADRRHARWLPAADGLKSMFCAVPAAAAAFLDRFGPHLKPWHRDLVQRLAPRAPQAYDLLWNGRLVPAHGDYRLDNMLFGVDPAAPPLVVVDWQTVCLAPPGLDLAVLLASSVGIDTRRDRELALITLHAEALVAAGVRDVEPEDIWRSYRAASLSPFLLTVLTAVTLKRTPRGDRMWLQLASQSAQAVLDLRAHELLEGS